MSQEGSVYITLLECSLVSTAAASSIPLPRMTHPEPYAVDWSMLQTVTVAV